MTAFIFQGLIFILLVCLNHSVTFHFSGIFPFLHELTGGKVEFCMGLTLCVNVNGRHKISAIFTQIHKYV